ncbi:hypothetical protein ECP030529313_2419, partial [Escherichia coli p0305293.13]
MQWIVVADFSYPQSSAPCQLNLPINNIIIFFLI